MFFEIFNISDFLYFIVYTNPYWNHCRWHILNGDILFVYVFGGTFANTTVCAKLSLAAAITLTILFGRLRDSTVKVGPIWEFVGFFSGHITKRIIEISRRKLDKSVPQQTICVSARQCELYLMFCIPSTSILFGWDTFV
jgi:hypothetical protein